MHTYTHICALKMIILLYRHTQAGVTLSVSFTPIPPKASPFLRIHSSVLLTTFPVSLTPPFKLHAAIPLRTSCWPLFPLLCGASGVTTNL